LRVQESSAANMGPATMGLDQQSHVELSKKIQPCVNAGGGHFEHTVK